jgi:hypothetical protein
MSSHRASNTARAPPSQQQFQDLLVNDPALDLPHRCIVVDLVKARLDVGVKYPRGGRKTSGSMTPWWQRCAARHSVPGRATPMGLRSSVERTTRGSLTSVPCGERQDQAPSGSTDPRGYPIAHRQSHRFARPMVAGMCPNPPNLLGSTMKFQRSAGASFAGRCRKNV